MSFRNVIARAFSLLLLGCFTASLRADIKTGDAFPAFAASDVVDLGGGSLPELQGKIVLVDFWASWCTPCKASFPAMAKLHADYAAKGLVVAAVSIDAKAKDATAFWQKMKPPFPTLHDRTQKLVKQVVVPTMPTSYLVGRDGRVHSIHKGFHGEASEKELRGAIEALLTSK